ncbi:MAG: class I SAM-dependent methyltransferase [Acidobacteria bacterium]|nr:MAG: class I SAM-dependent methyltransferase [Acidobacteriota bacterium]
MKAWIYDAVMVPLTVKYYREVLAHVPVGSHMLDVGIGTGSALTKNRDLVLSRDLWVTGLDVNPQYLERCRKNLIRHGLEDRVKVRLESIYDHRDGSYDVVYFSCSFMLLPEPEAALRHIADNLLKPDGRIIFTQTFQDKKSDLVERIKPHLNKVTTIEFGSVTYEETFRKQMSDAGIELIEMKVLSRSPTRSRSGRLAIAKPRSAS